MGSSATTRIGTDSPSAPTIIPNCSPRSIMRNSDSVPLVLTRTALSRPRRTKPTVVSTTSASWTTLPAGYCRDPSEPRDFLEGLIGRILESTRALSGAE